MFATANELSRVDLGNYSCQNIRNSSLSVSVSVKVLKNLSDPLARYIGMTVFKNNGDIVEVISIGKLGQEIGWA